MKKIKCILSLLLAVVMVSSLAVPVSASLFPFTDVPTTHTYYDAIKFVYDHGIMNGTGDTTFSPSGNMVRATAVVTLWRMAGHPQVAADMNFTDVPSSEWYYDAVCWAVETGITTGTTPTTFEPLRNVTQQELLIFLYRYAVSEDCCNLSFALPDPTRMTDRLDDSDYLYLIAPVSYDAVNWAMNCGILDDDLYYFDGDGVALRYTCADYLYKFMTLVCDDGKIFASSGFFTYGPVDEISDCMTELGYTPSAWYDVDAIVLHYAFYNADMIYVHGHGSANVIAPGGGDSVNKADIAQDSMEQVDLVYLSACKSGGDLLSTIYYTGGANACVGFDDTIWISTNDGGWAYYFNERFFYYFSLGDYSLNTCCKMALVDMGEKYEGEYHGTDSYVTYGYYVYD